jgi:hypothetical protein
MDVAGYDRGVVHMPSRLRAYAYGNGSVQLDLNNEQAVLLADDIDVGMRIRLGPDYEEPNGALSFSERLRTYANLYPAVRLNLNQEEALLLASDIQNGLEERGLIVPEPEKNGIENEPS